MITSARKSAGKDAVRRTRSLQSDARWGARVRSTYPNCGIHASHNGFQMETPLTGLELVVWTWSS
eukprot:4673613-Prymnesium_polylepis.2